MHPGNLLSLKIDYARSDGSETTLLQEILVANPIETNFRDYFEK